MKSQNRSLSWKAVFAGMAFLSCIGSVAYLGLGGENNPGRRHGDLTSNIPSESEGLANAGESHAVVDPVSASAPRKPLGVASPVVKTLLRPKGPAEGAPLGGTVADTVPALDKGRVVRLEAEDLLAWGKVSQGERILLPTPGGEELYGTVKLVSSDSGWYRFGGMLDGDKGTFQMNAGLNQVHGGIYFPNSGVGYQIEMDGSDVVLVERRLGALMCHPVLKRDAEGSLRVASGAVQRASGPQVIPEINSRPNAAGVIFVDFAGGLIESTRWGRAITAKPSTLSGAMISQVMARAAEDFSPFNLTLTTIRSVYDGYGVGSRMRVVVTPTDTAGPGTGGVAYVGSWKNGGADIVCWVFNEGVKSCADTIAHEVGHTLGLYHHGTKSGAEYYSGHGGTTSVPTSWGPIMGAPFGVNLTHWSRGEYFDANNTAQDDLSIIRTNNFGLVSVPGGSSSPRQLTFNGGAFITSGTLVSELDFHQYFFRTNGGACSLTVQPSSPVSTGDFKLELLDGNGAVVAVADFPSSLGASFSKSLAGGVYRAKITTAGTGAKPSEGYKTGYSPYGSLGAYSFSGRVEGTNTLPAFLNSRLITATEEQPLAVPFEVTDPANTTVTVLSQKLPEGLTLAAGTGAFGEATKFVLSGTLSKGSSEGVWSLTLQAKSSVGEARTTFDLVVSPQSLSLSSALGGKVTKIFTSPTSRWIGVSGTLADGSPGTIAQSGATPDRGTSMIQCEYTAPADARASTSLMTFYWRSDTEAGKDIVQCKIDGLVAKDVATGQPVVLSGKRGWVKQTVVLTGAGTRRIEFAYTKDANLRSDVDRVWLYGIDIGQPPVIKVPPVAALRVVPGSAPGSDSFTLSAQVLGNVGEVAWWKNGVALSNGTSASGSVVSGVNTGTLTVAGAKAADAGIYWIVARNAWGSVVSSRTEVVVWVPPVVTSQPVAPLGLKVGDPLILNAEVRGAQPMFYQWKKNGVPGRWTSTPSLTVGKTTEASAGKYVLVAVNPNGTVTSNEVTVAFTRPETKASTAAK